MAFLSVPAAASTESAPLDPGPGHKHDWQRESKRSWIAPKRKKVLVGTDKNGKPIYDWKVVRPGRWEIEYKSRCRKCGKTKKG